MRDIPEFTTRPELAGTFGMVASTHWLASAAGMAVLERGGNAFDAAVAAGLVLQVTEPHLNGLGGEVPVIAHHAGRAETFVLCGQGTAPAAATLEAFGDLGLDLVPGSGLLAACVPGAFGAWMVLLREHGTLRLRDVMDYAIGYATCGYPVLPAISWGIASVADLFRDHWPSSAEVYLPGGHVPAPGSLFANAVLAATYRRILEEAEAASGDRDEQIEGARRALYEGLIRDNPPSTLSTSASADEATNSAAADASTEYRRGLMQILGRTAATHAFLGLEEEVLRIETSRQPILEELASEPKMIEAVQAGVDAANTHLARVDRASLLSGWDIRGSLQNLAVVGRVIRQAVQSVSPANTVDNTSYVLLGRMNEIVASLALLSLLHDIQHRLEVAGRRINGRQPDTAATVKEQVEQFEAVGRFFMALDPQPVPEAMERVLLTPGRHGQKQIGRAELIRDVLRNGLLNGLAEHRFRPHSANIERCKDRTIRRRSQSGRVALILDGGSAPAP